jgi:DNA polymerase-3 subunit delta'
VPLEVARERLDATRTLDKFEQEQPTSSPLPRRIPAPRRPVPAAHRRDRFDPLDRRSALKRSARPWRNCCDDLSWQAASWTQLQQMRARLPHAILFHGPAGIGKADFIEAFAQALLCENVRADGQACGACVSCGWFAQGNHPDYRRVRPEALEDEAPPAEGEEGGAERQEGEVDQDGVERDQDRADPQLADFMNISTHRQGLRVVVLYPAEALNMPASNALLKTLEEPPPGTVFLLASNGLDRLLPTILSRCRKFALPMPDHAEALAWLQAQGVQDADGWLREQGGAPLAALAQAETGSREELDTLLQVLAQPSVESACAPPTS